VALLAPREFLRPLRRHRRKTAQEFDGSLSGALIKEAISWGKVTKEAKQTTLHAEVTTILPFIYAALLSKLKK
jgi:deoxyhypusine synthase